MTYKTNLRPLSYISQTSTYTGSANHLYGLTRLASIYEGSTTYHLGDGRGSTTAVVSGQDIIANYSWGAYGELLRGTYTESPFYGYDSEDYSPSTGTLYLRARYLFVAQGSFGVEDTYLGNAYIPQSLNLYAYAQGNPVRYVDPSGHFINVRGMVNAAVGFASQVWDAVTTFTSNAVDLFKRTVTNFVHGATKDVVGAYTGFVQTANNVHKVLSTVTRSNGNAGNALSVAARAATSALSQVAGLTYDSISQRVSNAFTMPVYFEKTLAATSLYNAIQHGYCGTAKPLTAASAQLLVGNNAATSDSAITITYDRQAVREYEEKYAGGPLTKVDYYVDASLGYVYRFGRNKSYDTDWSNCTGFVSQVLVAGGVPMTESWHSVSLGKRFPIGYMATPLAERFLTDWDTTDSWNQVIELHAYLTEKMPSIIYDKELHVYGDESQELDGFQNISLRDLNASTLEIQTGDLIFFYKTDEESQEKYLYHAAAVSSVSDTNVYYAGNTSRRLDTSLKDAFDADAEGVFILRVKDEFSY